MEQSLATNLYIIYKKNLKKLHQKILPAIRFVLNKLIDGCLAFNKTDGLVSFAVLPPRGKCVKSRIHSPKIN